MPVSVGGAELISVVFDGDIVIPAKAGTHRRNGGGYGFRPPPERRKKGFDADKLHASRQKQNV
jgi:hypothetical protein